MGLCDIHVIKEVLSRHGFHFSKSLGQNFLTAQWVPERIASECGVDKNSCALEVGPGMGCLTNELSKKAEKVVAIELDRALFPVLEETLAGCDNVEVVHGDVLKTNLSAICKEKFNEKKVYACANLPYYITTPAISALLDSKIFSGITVMVQKEVAKRICAKAGSSDYSAFSIYVQYYADAKILFDVPAGCFVPQPKVDSAVIRIDPLNEPSGSVQNEKLFFAIVRAAFNQRRKTLVNAISPAFGGKLDKADILSLMKTCELDERIRGEKLTPKEYAALSDAANELLKTKS